MGDSDETLGALKFKDFVHWMNTEFRKEIVVSIHTIVSDEITSLVKPLKEDIIKLKKDLTDTKCSLKSSEDKVNTLTAEVKALQEKANKTQTVSDNNLRYLINGDRDNRKYNILVMGVIFLLKSRNQAKNAPLPLQG